MILDTSSALLNQPASFDFHDTVMLSYNSLKTNGILDYDHDFHFEGFVNETGDHIGNKSVCAKDLNTQSIIPVFTADGLIKVRNSIKNLVVNKHCLVRDGADVSLLNHSLDLASEPNSLNVTGAIFSGTFKGHAVHSYVSIDEVNAICGVDKLSSVNISYSLLFETTLYRALQRVDDTVMSDEYRVFRTFHDMRNFNQIGTKRSEHDEAFQIAASTIVSREDYLTSKSSVWKQSFHQQVLGLSYSISNIAFENQLSNYEIASWAYKLCAESALENANLNPVNGDHYIFKAIDEQSKVTLSLKENCNGRLARCFARSGLSSVTADTVYSDDLFQFTANSNCLHESKKYNSKERGLCIGSYATLTFSDNSILSVFIDSKELLEVAEVSTSGTWDGVFADRMKIKHALSTALAQCDWGYKQPELKHNYH